MKNVKIGNGNVKSFLFTENTSLFFKSQWKYKKYVWITEMQKKNKRILWTIICQHSQQPRRNGQVSRNTEPTKIESRRNR